ncbi:MAG: hypothetical protein KDA91_07670 [Planctomycetaceae bacterium]|nr:hypothetical protein [Planctomycetaceae bacterium]
MKVAISLPDGMPLATEMLDIAREDILVLTDRPLRFGTRLRVAVFGDLVSMVVYTEAIVHFSRATHCGWKIGAFLDRVLPERLVDHHWDDLRSQIRYDCDWKAWVHTEQTGDLEAVHLIDYSLSGIRLALNSPLEMGTKFRLHSSAGKSRCVSLYGRIEWCRFVEGRYVAGALLPDQQGRLIPRLFGNLIDLHFDGSESGNHGISRQHLNLLDAYSHVENDQFHPATH